MEKEKIIAAEVDADRLEAVAKINFPSLGDARRPASLQDPEVLFGIPELSRIARSMQEEDYTPNTSPEWIAERMLVGKCPSNLQDDENDGGAKS